MKITNTSVHVDTVKVPVAESKRKKFFGRLADAFSGTGKSQTASAAQIMMVKRDTEIKTTE